MLHTLLAKTTLYVGLYPLRFPSFKGESSSRQAFPIKHISLGTQNLLLTSALRRPSSRYCSMIRCLQCLLQALSGDEMGRT